MTAKKKITLLRPNVVKYDEPNTYFVIMYSSPIYYDTQLGIETPVIFNLLELGKVIDGKPEAPYMDVKLLLDKNVGEFMFTLKSRVGYCGNSLAQHIFDELKNLNTLFRKSHLVDDIFERFINDDAKTRTKEQQEIAYKKLDFMKHRNILSEIICSQKIPKLSLILEKYDTKSLTKSFFDFITDRNKYVHGTIMYWGSEKKTIIEYEVNGEKEYAELDKHILNYFITCYKDLHEFLMEVQTTMNM